MPEFAQNIMYSEGLGQFLLILCIVNLATVYFQGEIAGRMHGNPTRWIIGFIFAPGATHYLWWSEWHFAQSYVRRNSVLKNFFDLIERSLYLDGIERRRKQGDGNVTPFSDSVVDRVLEVTSWPMDILNEWHDAKIDELIEWKQWFKAFERARDKLKEARLACDRRSIEVYRAYLMLLKPYVDPSQYKSTRKQHQQVHTGREAIFSR